jgi:hypothetical protein
MTLARVCDMKVVHTASAAFSDAAWSAQAAAINSISQIWQKRGLSLVYPGMDSAAPLSSRTPPPSPAPLEPALWLWYI